MNSLAAALVLGALVPLGRAAGQTADRRTTTSASYADAVAQWIALPAAPGHERRALDVIATSLPGWTREVIFVWSVREEVGLDGAAVVARAFGPSVRRVHAIDTFVSSDSPLENPRFADAVLGGGAALRALDNSSVTPPTEVDRVVGLAASHGIPLQVGTTNGGNDGSTFVPWGAVDVPIGWPLRYSHSPAEVIDLRDVVSLSRIVAAVAIAP